MSYAARPSRLKWVAAIATVAVALVVAGVLYVRQRPVSTEPGAIKTIAVLPFVDAGQGGGADDYFVEGMSDELSAALGRIPGMQVASRTSTYAFKGESVDVREVGTRLKVDAVLEGRVRRAGDRLRVTAQLTNVNTGLSFWTDSYEREVKDVFAVQDDIARAIASALQVRLEAAAASQLENVQGTSNLEAYDLYLRGRYFWHRRGEANLNTAITFFQQAITRDPNFARAYAGLAIAQVLLPEYTDAADAADFNSRGEASARRALELDSTLAEAYAAQGLARVHAWDWSRAEAAYRRAISFEPRYPTGHQWMGELSYHLGRTNDGVMHMRRAVELDPLAPIAAAALSYALLGNRQYAEAVAEAERSASLAPDLGLAWRGIAQAAVMAGQREKAVQAANRAVELEPNFDLTLAQKVYILGTAGRRQEAMAAFRDLQRRSPRAYALAWGYLGIGDTERAAAELERAANQHDLLLTNFSVAAEPAYDPIRTHPAYQRTIRLMGLAPYVQARR